MAYFDVVAAGSAEAAPSPVGRKRPRPASNDEHDEQPEPERQGTVISVAATARRGRSPAKGAMVSIANLLRVPQERGSNSDAAASSLADGGCCGGGCETGGCDRALSWRDDDLPNAVMSLPKVLPQWAIADPKLYAARMKAIADEEEEEECEEEEENNNNNDEQQPSRRKQRAKRDPRQPKKAKTAYNYFVLEFHEKIRAEQQKDKQRAGGSEGGEEKKEDNGDDDMDDQPHKKFTEVGRKMGQQWKDLNEDDRRKYDDLAARDKGRYTAEMEVYNATKQREEAEMTKEKDAATEAAAMSTKGSGEAKTAAARGTNEQHPKGKLKTPTANRLVSGNRSADGGVLGSIGSGGGDASSSSSPTKRTRTPAKLLTSVPAPDIGEGWTIKTYQRQSGSSAGHTDSYWYSPALGKKFRSLKEIGRFKEALARVHADADAGGAALDAAHAERLAWKAFKQAAAGAKK